MKKISHRISGGQVSYDEMGLHFSTRILKNKFTLKWSEIDFCCMTPWVKKETEDWITYNDLPLEKLSFFNVQFVITNRQALLNKNSYWNKIWIRNHLLLKPLYDADDQPKPYQGVIQMSVNLKSLNVERHVLVEHWKKYTTFKLIVSEW